MGINDSGLSSQRLGRIDAFLRRRYIDTGRLPGTVLLIERHGEIAHSGALGLADVARGRPIAMDSIFRIFSMTKPVTSVAFMMLVEAGEIALDDPVDRYIPAWRDLAVHVSGEAPPFRTRPPDRPMQVIDLLRHTSGLTLGLQNRTPVDAAYRAAAFNGMPGHRPPLGDMIAELADLPLDFSPGEAWNYSLSTDVLGYLIEVVSGMSFRDFVQERLLRPLGMTDTDFYVPPQKSDRLTACYWTQPDGSTILFDDPQTSYALTMPKLLSGAGGLMSTAGDYLTFCRMLLAGGKAGDQRFLSRKTVALMTANHLPGGADLSQMSRSLFSEASNAGIGFGLGFAVTTDPVRAMVTSSVGEYDWGGAASTHFWIDPLEELIVVFMTQLLPSTLYPLRRELRTLVYSAFDD